MNAGGKPQHNKSGRKDERKNYEIRRISGTRIY